MHIILDFFQYIINLGVSVMMPIIITVLGLIFGNKLSSSFKSGLTVGLGFVGLNAITALMIDAISPVTRALVKQYNFQLTATDMGWGVGASLAWGTEVVPFVFLTIIATNVIMILFNWTKTMDVDIWNFWEPMAIASALYLTTRNLFIALLSAVINMAIIFKIADWTQKDVDEVLGLEGISFPHLQSTGWALIGYPLNWILDRIPGIKNISWTPEKVQNKLGIFGEPMFMGLFIGGGLAAVARMPVATVLQTAVKIAASLVLIPKMVALLMDGLTLISESAQEWMQKRFPGRQLYIGLDSALGIGHPYVLTTGLLMIPFALVLAFILPGNKVLPLADLTALPYFMIFAILPSKGNLFRGLISGILFTIIILYCASYAAPIVTQLAVQVGYHLPKGSTQVTSLAVGAQWYTWIIYWILGKFAALF
ncbi:PTS galactitol transporter subunit IIC [Lacticaseibacillus paracasei]|uniref:PTS galactitol transporter subunit IIC n=1 Tax=Lacticaseibacillus paracasei TaxID=1597 RepID=UPI0003437E48|nr:PTS transporter subunit IIC [Lacticaseibacillus paracasei]EPC18155.1 PTS system, galactitol-specific IIC component [Lacticaseibacillus paracasei subsp. paracasei Lpp230]MCT3361659.1 PTS galactitol transporter subunit IIC [Lacticaseibacillus paracasei]MDS0491359.1 PTS galactitol transporter subunit IIC [Lacticaseibacillus paracasei]UNG79096.1 PTS galactitol transporter subunit IIC [Lacticaseibacillus paracasei]